MDNRNENFELQINNCILNENRADWGSGGAIHMDNRNGNFELQINNCILNGNRAGRGSGGAIYIIRVSWFLSGPVSYQLQVSS